MRLRYLISSAYIGVGSAPEGFSVTDIRPFQATPLGYSFETFKYKTALSIPVS